jgi:hypothetical protein
MPMLLQVTPRGPHRGADDEQDRVEPDGLRLLAAGVEAHGQDHDHSQAGGRRRREHGGDIEGTRQDQPKGAREFGGADQTSGGCPHRQGVGEQRHRDGGGGQMHDDECGDG